MMDPKNSLPQSPGNDAHQPVDTTPSPAASAPEQSPASQTLPSGSHRVITREFSSPGLTPARRYGTAIMLFLLGVFIIGVVFYSGGPLIVSAVLGFLLMAGFIWYLRMIAPAPFTLRLTPEGLVRQEQSGAPLVIPWDSIARVKEEQFSNGKIIGVMIYARSTRSVYRALVLYRDDLPHFDEFRQALKASTLPETPWKLETVHE